MLCSLCGNEINKKVANRLELCDSCVSGIELISYKRAVLTKKLFVLKLNILFTHKGPIKDLVAHFKFNRELKLSHTIAELMSNYFEFRITPDILIPVPSHPIEEIKRGYSHMSVLAMEISKRMGLDHINAIKENWFPIVFRSQKAKNRAQRTKNNERFSLRVPSTKIKGKNILIIYDVMTTGATIEECAELLLKNGARRVEAMCLGLAPM